MDRILSAIGLKRHMTWRNTGSPIYNEANFKTFVSKEYLESERKQTDEVYRMSEITLLHKATGVRTIYVTTESYDGDSIEYRIANIFIVSAGKSYDVVDADFNKEIFFTKDNAIPFSEVDREVKKT